jgi:hypothetical protein
MMARVLATLAFVLLVTRLLLEWSTIWDAIDGLFYSKDTCGASR